MFIPGKGLYIRVLIRVLNDLFYMSSYFLQFILLLKIYSSCCYNHVDSVSAVLSDRLEEHQISEFFLFTNQCVMCLSFCTIPQHSSLRPQPNEQIVQILISLHQSAVADQILLYQVLHSYRCLQCSAVLIWFQM